MTRPADAQHGVLVLSCKDAPGIVHAVSGLLLDEGCTIVESHQFDSLTSGMFYMRVEFAHGQQGVVFVVLDDQQMEIFRHLTDLR